MLGRTSEVGLSRRVVTLYLVFGLTAILWLAVGVVFVARSVLESRAETLWLARLGGAANAIRTAAVRGEDGFQPLVERFCSDWGLAYSAVVSEEGRFVAHSSPEQVGRRWRTPLGEAASWGDAQRTRYISGDSRMLREYQTPVKRGGQICGTLVLAVPDPGVWGTVWSVVGSAPAALLLPMLVIVIGAAVLRRMVRPMAQVADQLQEAATALGVSEVRLRPVSPGTAAGIGWNRLVGLFQGGTPRADSETRLNRALEAYRQTKLEHILNSLADGVAVTDENGRIQFANKALAGLLGMGASDETLSGRTMKDCLAVDSAREAAGQLLDPAFGGRTLVVELPRPGDVPPGVLRVARSPLSGAPGEGSGGHVWSVRDVTQQKLADQMRDQFVNAATHELRTPMTNIKAYAEMLVDSDVLDVEKQKAFCNTINEEVTRLARFVDDLLQLSRMEVGSTSLKQQVTDLERLLHDTVNKVRPQMEQKNVAFDVELPAKLPELVVDKDKLTVALVNLLGNAAKYTPEGGRVGLSVEIGEVEVRIDVEDTGIGIAAEELPRIFDKFFRSSDPRVHGESGSGLGLALTHEIVRLHGGRLSVHSELNKGSKFTVTLPMAAERVPCSSA